MLLWIKHVKMRVTIKETSFSAGISDNQVMKNWY